MTYIEIDIREIRQFRYTGIRNHPITLSNQCHCYSLQTTQITYIKINTREIRQLRYTGIRNYPITLPNQSM